MTTNSNAQPAVDLPQGDTDNQERSVFRIVIRAPIHKVWAELTRTDAVLPFFFNAVCHTTELGQGAPVRMRSHDGKYTSVVGEVLEFEPPYRYAHTFRFTNFDDAACVVRYQLQEVDDGTEFTLINEGVPAGTRTEKYMTQGGRFITENLKAIVETGKPTVGGRFALLLMGLFAPFTPQRCRSKHWPL